MILTVPFAYTASVLYKRHRVPDTEYLRDQVSIKIEEIDHAPVALRWDVLSRMGAKGGRLHDVLWHDGKLWDPHLVTAPQEDGAPRPMTAEELVSSMQGNGHPPIPAGHPHARGAKLLSDLDNVKSVLSSDREQEIAAIQRRASELLLVGGILYEAGVEPVYLVDWHHAFTSVKAVRMDRAGSQDPSLVFRADRREEAVEAARRMGGEVHDRHVATIEVLMPEVLRYDDETPAFMAVAGHALDRAERHLKEADVAFFSAYARLRDAIRSGGGPEPDVREAAEGLAAEIDPEGPLGGLRKEMEAALERWSLRPADGAEAEPEGFAP
jgi:hypothetical protein